MDNIHIHGYAILSLSGLKRSCSEFHAFIITGSKKVYLAQWNNDLSDFLH